MKTNDQIRILLHPDWHLLPFGEKKKEVEFIKKSIANSTKKKWLFALPIFPKAKGYCHPTILVSAYTESEAMAIVRWLRPDANIGDYKQVFY